MVHSMSGTNRIVAAALISGISFPALAESAPDATQPAAQADASETIPGAAGSVGGVELAAAETIVVTGQRDVYGARRSSTATKTDTPILDIPQALTVISEKQVEDQALRSVSELLYFVPGATPGTGESNRDQFTLRGNNTTADLFLDGIRDDARRVVALHDELLPAESFGEDGFGARIQPYRSTLAPGGAGDFEVTVRNPFDGAGTAVVRLVLPDGWSAQPPEREVELAPDGEEVVTFAVTAGAAGGRIAADLIVGDTRFGEQAEALVDVG